MLPCIYKRLLNFCHSLSYFCTSKQRCPLRKSSGSSKVQNLCNLRCPVSKIGSRTKIASSRNFPYLKMSWKWWKVLIFFQSHSKCLINEFLPFGKIIIPSLLTCGQLRHSLQNEKFQNSLKSALLGRDGYCTYICSASWKKLGSNDFTCVYLLTFSLQKEIFFCFEKKSGERLKLFLDP